MKKKPTIEVTGFWMRTVPFTSSGDVVRDQGSDLQAVEVLVEHNGKWITIFGPKGAGECAYVNAQNIDNMIHPGGINNLVKYGKLHVGVVAEAAPIGVQVYVPIRTRKTGKPERRSNTDRRADKRRLGDKTNARLAARKR